LPPISGDIPDVPSACEESMPESKFNRLE